MLDLNINDGAINSTIIRRQKYLSDVVCHLPLNDCSPNVDVCIQGAENARFLPSGGQEK